ncbi:MAG: phage terminase large subunit [Pirellulales bacterium]
MTLQLHTEPGGLSPLVVAGLARNLAQLVSRRNRERQAAEAALPPGERFLQWAQSFLPRHLRCEPSAMHRWLAAELERSHSERGALLNVVGPRGGAKSTLVTLAYVLYAALELEEPYVWIVSDTRQQAALHLENIKAELTENERLAEEYPAATGRGATWRAASIVLPSGVAIEAFGVGQRLRGRRHGPHRPSLIVCDDLQNDRQVLAAEQRSRLRAWFHGMLLKAGDRRTNIVHLGTALHREALAPELANAPGWTARVFPAVLAWPSSQALWDDWRSIYCDLDRRNRLAAAKRFYLSNRAAMDEGAELLWPARDDLYSLMCMQVSSGRVAFEREMQGRPLGADECEFPDSYFDGDLWFHDWPRDAQVRVMALDPSKGREGRLGDYSAFVLLAVDAAGRLYVEADLARRPTPRIVADGVELWLRFRPEVFGVEATQFQELLCGELAAEFTRRGLHGARLAALDNQASKLVRIRRLGPLLSAGRLRFRAGSASTQQLVDQLRDFPTGDHDDGPDALEMAVRLAAEELAATQAPRDGLGERLTLVG